MCVCVCVCVCVCACVCVCVCACVCACVCVRAHLAAVDSRLEEVVEKKISQFWILDESLLDVAQETTKENKQK